ncbi:MAG: hypothetical protein ED559_02395 [Phycisphaera sp.]|nr:MAG: hypothetical protein ED559_02395 [Phycisphaera sp.]
MKSVSILCAVIASTCAAEQSSAQETIQYTFDIEVLQNEIATNGIGGDLATLDIGTVGEISFLVNTDDTIFPPDDSSTQFYQTLDVSIGIGAINSGAVPGAYPSSTFFDGIGVTNDGPNGSDFFDFFGGLLRLDHPEIGLAILTLSQRTSPDMPTLLSSTDLPLSLDTSLANNVDFIIESALGGGDRVVFEVVSFEATQVPAPSSLVFVGLGSILLTRSRREYESL